MTYPFTSGTVVTADMMNQMGLHLITPTSVTGGTLSGATVTFSSVSSVAIDGVFTTAFSHYRIVLSVTTGAGGAAQIQANMRAGGTATVGSSYYGYYRGITWSGGNDVTANNGGSNWFIMRTNGAEWSGAIDIQNPQAATKTFIQSLGCDTSQTWNAGGYHNSSTQFDGISFSNSGSSNMTGTIRVYGYSNG